MSGTGQLQQAGEQPGIEEQREGDQAGCSGELPRSGAERDQIEGDEDRGRQAEGEYQRGDPLRMDFGEYPEGAEQGPCNEDDDKGLEGGGMELRVAET